MRNSCWLTIVAVTAAACTQEAPRLQSISGAAQGTTYAIQWWTPTRTDTADFGPAVDRELERIDALLSNYRKDSAIERFNAARTVGSQPLPPELVSLLRIAGQVHEASDGCFDPTVRPIVALWGLDGTSPRVPETAAIDAVLARVGFAKIEITAPDAARKTVEDLEVDMSSIGQGHTVSRLGQLADAFGIEHYLVEIGGEIVGRGHKPDGEPWRVGVEEPRPPEGAAGQAVRRRITLPTDRPAAVITSGTYRHYFEAGGTRYSHIIDPRAGMPVRHDLVSVTVLDSDATRAAAWATALLCLGPERAAAAAEREQLAALMFVRDGDSVREHRSAALAAEWEAALD